MKKLMKRIGLGLFLMIVVCLFALACVALLAVMIPAVFVFALTGYVYMTPDWKIETRK